MSTAAERRLAYGIAAERLRHDCPADFGGVDLRLTMGVVEALEQMIRQLEEASKVKDEPGVEGHVAGDGKVKR